MVIIVLPIIINKLAQFDRRNRMRHIAFELLLIFNWSENPLCSLRDKLLNGISRQPDILDA